MTEDDVLAAIKRSVDHFGYFPTSTEYVRWARERGEPSATTVYKHIGSWKNVAEKLGYEYVNRTGKHGKGRTWSVKASVQKTPAELKKIRSDYMNVSDISKYYEVSRSTIQSLRRKGRFPEPDFYVNPREGGGLFWHRLKVSDFFKEYGPNWKEKYRATSRMRRDDVLLKARSVIAKKDIQSPREFIQHVKEHTGGMVDPRTLWAYSITFEEIAGKEHIGDPVCYDILNMVRRRKRTAKELAHLLEVDVRTIYRKVDRLREKGFDIKGDKKGLWL